MKPRLTRLCVSCRSGVLAGAAVALMVLGYLAIYLFVFLARGPVG
jgi:hypothetical protein